MNKFVLTLAASTVLLTATSTARADALDDNVRGIGYMLAAVKLCPLEASKLMDDTIETYGTMALSDPALKIIMARAVLDFQEQWAIDPVAICEVSKSSLAAFK